ncbi:MAG: hypothetical protein RJA07_337 [Bacteroidota bacterium]|jgi:hypothetical protein
MKLGRIYILIIFLLLHQISNAAGIKFTASVSKNPVAVGEQIQVTYSVENAEVRGIKPPTFNGFAFLQGPNQSSNMTFVNGKMSSSMSFTYFLQAAKEGKFTFAPATATTAQGNIESNEITIEIKGSLPKQQNNQTQQQQSTLATPDLSKEVFLKVFVDKTNVYEGEQITATYKLYFKVNIGNPQFDKLPSLNGFWSQNYDIPQRPATQENVNGVIYNVAELKRVALFPQQGGTLTIDPIKMKLVAQIKAKRKKSNNPLDNFFNDPFFDDPFFSPVENVPLEIQSGAVSINVKPLPANKPESFTGAVGRFRMNASADKTNISTDDAITYKVTISGNGNINLFDNPAVKMSSDFEVYDPKIAENIPKDANPIGGSKTFEYLIIPRVAGDYKIPALAFSYFDLDKHDYVTLNSSEINLTIKQGKNQNNAMANGVKKEDLKLLNQDIRFIKTDTINFTKSNTDKLFGSALFWWLIALPFILSFGVLVYVKRAKMFAADKSAAGFKQASRLARKRLMAAEKLMKQKNEKGFYDEVMRSLHGYVNNKLQIQTADLSKENIAEAFKQKNIGEQLTHQFITTLDNCEMALYAPSAVQGGMEQVYKNASDVIVQLEGKMM